MDRQEASNQAAGNFGRPVQNPASLQMLEAMNNLSEDGSGRGSRSGSGSGSLYSPSSAGSGSGSGSGSVSTLSSLGSLYSPSEDISTSERGRRERTQLSTRELGQRELRRQQAVVRGMADRVADAERRGQLMDDNYYAHFGRRRQEGVSPTHPLYMFGDRDLRAASTSPVIPPYRTATSPATSPAPTTDTISTRSPRGEGPSFEQRRGAPPSFTGRRERRPRDIVTRGVRGNDRPNSIEDITPPFSVPEASGGRTPATPEQRRPPGYRTRIPHLREGAAEAFVRNPRLRLMSPGSIATERTREAEGRQQRINETRAERAREREQTERVEQRAVNRARLDQLYRGQNIETQTSPVAGRGQNIETQTLPVAGLRRAALEAETQRRDAQRDRRIDERADRLRSVINRQRRGQNIETQTSPTPDDTVLTPIDTVMSPAETASQTAAQAVMRRDSRPMDVVSDAEQRRLDQQEQARQDALDAQKRKEEREDAAIAKAAELEAKREAKEAAKLKRAAAAEVAALEKEERDAQNKRLQISISQSAGAPIRGARIGRVGFSGKARVQPPKLPKPVRVGKMVKECRKKKAQGKKLGKKCTSVLKKKK